jgi:hypothetical protein
MRNFSGPFRLAFVLIVGGMIVLAVFALLTQPAPPGPLTEAQIEQTVVAEVNMRLTQTAGVAPPTAMPDIDATVAARLAETPAPTNDPNLIPADQLEESGGIVALIGGVINTAFSLLRSTWNLFSFGGVWLQVCCCLVIPIGALMLLARESRPAGT